MKLISAMTGVLIAFVMANNTLGNEALSGDSVNGLVLTKIVAYGGLHPDKVALENSKTKKKISIPWKRPFTLKELPAGEYFLSRIYSSFDSVASSEYRKPKQLIIVAPGKITYIGDIVIESEDLGRGYNTSFKYEVNAATLTEAAEKEREKFVALDTVISLPGQQPIPIERAALGL
jgi:hypothetical protein